MFPILFILQRVSTFNINKMYFPELILFLKKKKKFEKSGDCSINCKPKCGAGKDAKEMGKQAHVLQSATSLCSPGVALKIGTNTKASICT